MPGRCDRALPPGRCSIRGAARSTSPPTASSRSFNRALRHATGRAADASGPLMGDAVFFRARHGRPGPASPRSGRDRALPCASVAACDNTRMRRGTWTFPPGGTRRSRPWRGRPGDRRRMGLRRGLRPHRAPLARTRSTRLGGAWRGRTASQKTSLPTGTGHWFGRNQAGGPRRGTRPCSPPRCAATTCAPNRQARFLRHGRAFRAAPASKALRRLGGVPAEHGNAERPARRGATWILELPPRVGRGTRNGTRRRYRLEAARHGGSSSSVCAPGATIVALRGWSERRDRGCQDPRDGRA